MGRGSTWRPSSARVPPAAKRHRGKGASYRPDNSQHPLPERHEPHAKLEPYDWKPEHSQPHDFTRRRKRNKAPLDSSHPSVNLLKSKIRDLTRALEHADLPADVRVEKERALAGYAQDLENALEEKRKRELIKRYHMVRFVGMSSSIYCSVTLGDLRANGECKERQKATRHVKKLQKRLLATPPDTPDHEQLEASLHLAQVDLNYTLYYPLSQKYEALFPRKEEIKSENMENGDPIAKPAMWEVVKRCMEDGTLDSLRDGTLEIVLGVGRMKPFKKESRRSQSHQKDKVNVGSKPSVNGQSQEMDEDSDGGFFEKKEASRYEPT